MDEISKENILNPEVETAPEVLAPQESVGTEIAPESLPQELGETPSPNVSNQNDYAEEVANTYPEEEIVQEIADVDHLPQEEKLMHLKEVAQKDSLEKAIRMVKGMNDPWLEDKLHDELIDDPDFRVKLEELVKIEKL